jgi:manganese transport system ATP-binding protein
MPDPVTEFVAQAQRLTVGYTEPAIVDATFQIPAGAVTAIIGPNGSGKSTLLHALTGLLTPRSGELTVLGTSPDRARRRMAYVLQSISVPPGTPLTVREAVAMGRYSTAGPFRRLSRADRARVDQAMSDLGITDLARAHVADLSGGQRQRVFVAQGLAQDHDVLVLDEPLTGLDLVSAEAIDRIIHAETDRGCSVVHSTHDLDEARAADYVLLLGQRTVRHGLPEGVLTPALLQEAYGLGSHHPMAEGSEGLPTPHHDPDHRGP